MKKLSLIFLIVFSLGCDNPNLKKDALPISKILSTELLDLKPYLVLKNGVDTLYEIITDGKIGFTEKGDTLSSFINVSDTIHAKLNSVMCCTYEYYFKNELLIYSRINSDYTAINNYEYYSNGQNIYRIDRNSLTDTTIFRVINNKINWKLDLHYPMDDTTFYFYENDHLIKKVEFTKSVLNDSNIKYTTEFKWSKIDNSLDKIIYKGSNTLQIIDLDKNGIPKESTYINYDSLKSDTICKTKFQKFISTK